MLGCDVVGRAMMIMLGGYTEAKAGTCNAVCEAVSEMKVLVNEAEMLSVVVSCDGGAPLSIDDKG